MSNDSAFNQLIATRRCLEHGVPIWFEPTMDRMIYLLKLRPDWNSYGALKVSADAVRVAWEVLACFMNTNSMPPTVVPTSSGGLQLEWSNRGVDLEIYVPASGQCTMNLEDLDAQTEWEGTLEQGLPRLQSIVSRLQIQG